VDKMTAPSRGQTQGIENWTLFREWWRKLLQFMDVVWTSAQNVYYSNFSV